MTDEIGAAINQSFMTQTDEETRTVLAIDLGGSHVKVSLSTIGGKRAEESGPLMTPDQMVEAVKDLASGWNFDVIGMGYPGTTANNRPGPTVNLRIL